MFKLHRVLLAGAILALASSSSMAGVLPAGTLSAFASPVTLSPGSDVLTSTTFDVSTYINLSPGTDSLSAVPAFSMSGPSSLNLANLSAFSFTIGGFTFNDAWGYTDSSNVTGDTKTRSILVYGHGHLGGNDNTAQVLLTFSQFNGGTPSAQILIQVPAAVPEPSSVALAGIGLSAAGLFGLRKRLAK